METPSSDPPPVTQRPALVGKFGTPRDGAGFVNRRINLVKLARAQRCLIFSIMAYFAAMIVASSMTWFRVRRPITGTSFDTVDFVMFAIAFVVAVCAFRLALAYGMGPLLSVLLGLAMAVPCVGLLLLVVVNSLVDDVLKHEGVKVGLLGVGAAEMHKLRIGVCLGCGYDLRGLLRAVCPECGKAVRV